VLSRGTKLVQQGDRIVLSGFRRERVSFIPWRQNFKGGSS